MTRIENYINIAKRKGYNKMPPNISLCPSLRKRFEEYCHRTGLEYRPSHIDVPDLIPNYASSSDFLRYYNRTFKEGTTIDNWGIAHEPGSKYAFHMTQMYHPMKDFDSVEQVLAYPFPDYKNTDDTAQKEFVKKAHAQDTVAVGSMQMTIWERAWYLRGMENLMVDMMTEDPLAEALLDIITDIAVTRAESFAKSGVDVRIITPHVWDKRLVHATTRSYYSDLISAGVRVFEYTPGFMHEKLMICDGEAATVGTTNLDFRSLYMHFECGVLLYGCRAVSEAQESFMRTLESSREITAADCKSGMLRSIGRKILRLFAPLM